MKKLRKISIMTLVWLRWAYFHLHPSYVKFYMTQDEAHFQHVKTGAIYSNFEWVDSEEA